MKVRWHKALGYFLDFLSFTLKIDTEIPGIALSYFYKYVPLEIEEGELFNGIDGYNKGIKFPSGIKVLFAGKITGMGIHIILPGLGLKSEHLQFDVFELIAKLKKDKMPYNISRIDVAVDTDVDFSYFYNKFVKKQYVCRYNDRSIRQVVDANLRGTLYFGRRGGLTMFRVYDKALEQEVTDGRIWTRIEMECRNEACEQIIEALKNDTVKNYFLGHLRFIKRRMNEMKRAKTTDTYLRILEQPIERMKVHAKKSDNTLEWFVSQVAPTVKALKKDYGEEYIDKIIDEAKISKRQIKDRFKLEVINPKLYVNGETGEIFEAEPLKITKEYIQSCLEQIAL